MRKIALIACLLACSPAATETDCSATVSGAGNFGIGCNAHETLDYSMSGTRSWIIEFPDGGPIYTVTGDQMVEDVYLFADGTAELNLPAIFRPPGLRTIGSVFIRDPDGGTFMLQLPSGDAGPLGNGTLTLTGETVLDGGKDVSFRAFRGTLSATFVRQLVDGGPGTDTANLDVSF
jgi:hypothetical protein